MADDLWGQATKTLNDGQPAILPGVATENQGLRFGEILRPGGDLFSLADDGDFDFEPSWLLTSSAFVA
jgi:hypothetical protein